MKSKLGFELRGNPNNPYHKSVGFILFDNKKNIALIKKLSRILTLPRETQHANESPLDYIKRGAKEEIGRTVKVKRFIGSLITKFYLPDGTKILKTTDYFEAEVTGKVSQAKEVDEKDDTVVWMTLKEARKLLLDQGTIEEGGNEAEILLRTI